jgi:hypothetical protein
MTLSPRLRNPNGHYSARESQSLDTAASQINPFGTITIVKINFNIIPDSMSRSQKRVLPIMITMYAFLICPIIQKPYYPCPAILTLPG